MGAVPTCNGLGHMDLLRLPLDDSEREIQSRRTRQWTGSHWRGSSKSFRQSGSSSFPDGIEQDGGAFGGLPI